MNIMINRILSICALTVALTFSVLAAPAPYSLFGDAQLVSPGHDSPTAAKLISAESPGYGGIDFNISSGLSFADYIKLSTDYFVSAGNCGAGSPRFQLDFTNPNTNQTGTLDVYFQNVNVSQSCLTNQWVTSGNLVQAGYVENFTEHPNLYIPFADAQQQYGDYEITGIQLVIDSGYLYPQGEAISFDNVMINANTFTFESANSCKNGGWQSFSSAPGPFTNQGQCVSYFARGGQ
jgi:hypothetical protein